MILTERLGGEITIGDPNSRCVGGYFVLEWEGNQMGWAIASMNRMILSTSSPP
jgi:hypothetical protein